MADRNTLVPGSNVTFDQLTSHPPIDGGNVGFVGNSLANSGVYFDVGGSLVKVIDQTDSLDGKSLREARFTVGYGAVSNHSIAFGVTFADGS